MAAIADNRWEGNGMQAADVGPGIWFGVSYSSPYKDGSWRRWAVAPNTHHITKAIFLAGKDEDEDIVWDFLSQEFGDLIAAWLGPFSRGFGRPFCAGPCIRFGKHHILVTSAGGLDI